MGVPYWNLPAAIQFGEVICRALAGGTPVSTLVTMTTSDGCYSRMQAHALIGAAQGGLCRQSAEIRRSVSQYPCIYGA
jgi:hypothetical protein